MMPTIRAIDPTGQSDPFALEGDKGLFDRIVADQERNAGSLRPAPNWDLGIGGQDGQRYFESQQSGEAVETGLDRDRVYDEKFSSLRKMMDPFVGCTGLRKIDDETLQEYQSFLKGIDRLNILPSYFEEDGKMKDAAADLMVTDLGSILDINIIASFLDPSVDVYHILEVGGGYGRLAEVFYRLYKKERVKYVLLDAVPASLMYAYLYLSKNLPDLQIGFYYNGDPLDLERFDCYVMPSWHFDSSTWTGKFDCCINIQSMQEMNQYHVDYYLGLFDQVLKSNSGIAYISNEKDYIFRGNWNYPESWQRLLETRTPRSWTRNSPTEVFRKSARPRTAENDLIDFLYTLQLKELDRNADQAKTISSLGDELNQKEEAISTAEAALAAGQQEIAAFQAVLGEKEQEISAARATLGEKDQKINRLESILWRAPFLLEERTPERVEEAIRQMDRYYLSAEASGADRLFEKLNKISAHLLAFRLYVAQRRTREAFSHLGVILRLDAGMLLSTQALRIIAGGLLRLR